MRDNVINVYKKVGQTPLECINILKKNKEELRFIPMTYAGRLDPLAEGLILILTGDECLKKNEYLSLPKVYEVDILFGFATDTYDVMGKIIKYETPPEILLKRSSDYNKIASFSFQFSDPRMREDEGLDHENWQEDFVHKIQNILPKFIGRIKQSYPPYSSRTVNGKPLFEWAREGKIDEIEIPTHNVFVESIEIIGEREINGKELIKKIKEDISLVNGDFRQKEILSLWNKELIDKGENIFPIIKLRVSCGSGVYVRGLAYEIGQKLGIPTLAFTIVRTKVGEYVIN